LFSFFFSADGGKKFSDVTIFYSVFSSNESLEAILHLSIANTQCYNGEDAGKKII